MPAKTPLSIWTLHDTAWASPARLCDVRLTVHSAAQWPGGDKGPAFFAYSDNYLIDVKFGVIVDQMLRAW